MALNSLYKHSYIPVCLRIYGINGVGFLALHVNLRTNLYLLKLIVSIILKMNVCNGLHATIERVDVAQCHSLKIVTTVIETICCKSTA